jgi:Flp pilus assembly protein CpaB
MEMEYQDPSKRGRWIIVLGVVLAVGAAAGAFYLVNTAQQSAGRGELKYMTAVVAAKPLAAKTTLTQDDLVVRTDIPVDNTNALGGLIVTQTSDLVGRILGVDVAQNQLVTLNLLASTSVGGQFPILGPGETVGPDSVAWRAVSITVPDADAVGGMLAAGMSVDVLMTMQVKAPPAATPEPLAPGATPTPTPNPSSRPPAYTDGLSTKVTYQAMKILARQGTSYVLKATLPVAEEITQATLDGATYTLLMRPDQDKRILDVSQLGATTSRILLRYGLLIPETWAPGQPVPSNPPIPALTPAPSPSGSTAPDGSAAPSASASAGG